MARCCAASARNSTPVLLKHLSSDSPVGETEPEILAQHQPERHGSLVLAYGGHDPGVCARAHAAQPLWLSGYPDQALASSDHSLALARQLSLGPSFVHALFHAVWLDQFRRDPIAARQRAETLAHLAGEQGQFMYVAISSVLLGWSAAVTDESEAGIRLLRRGLEEFRSTGARDWAPYYEALLAEALWQAGKNQEALTALRRAQDAAKEAADRFFWEAEMVRLEGQLLFASGAIREDEGGAMFPAGDCYER